MSGKKRTFVVIGLGIFGRTIATQLAKFGNHVLGIDSDEGRVNDVIDELSDAVIADSRDEKALREAGVDQYDVAVVAIGEDLESNVLCTMNARMLGVDAIWAKAVNRTHHTILERLGADRVIHPEEEIGQHVAQMLHNPLVRDYLSLGDDNFLVDLSIPDAFDGKRLAELKLSEHEGIRVVGIVRAHEYLDAKDEQTVLESDDKLLLLGRRDTLRDFSDSL
ncbi:MAG: TrkA family potassium uptake protein [Wenzhouxiangellaceae bacterium]